MYEFYTIQQINNCETTNPVFKAERVIELGNNETSLINPSIRGEWNVEEMKYTYKAIEKCFLPAGQFVAIKHFKE